MGIKKKVASYELPIASPGQWEEPESEAVLGGADLITGQWQHEDASHTRIK